LLINEESNRPAEGWRQRLYVIIFEADTYWGKFFDVVLLWAIVVSVALVIFESEKSLRTDYSLFFEGAEWFFTILFTLELVLRLLSSRFPSRYIFSFFGVVDIVSILPSYLGLMVSGVEGLLVVRALRLLRVFRIFKVARFLRAGATLMAALRQSAAKVIVFLMAVMVVVIIMGTVMYIVEGEEGGFSSIPRGMYWVVVTMTTVGYGDIVPTTPLGKFLASAIMLLGYGVIAVPTGIVAREMIHVEEKCPHCHKPISISGSNKPS